jgi:hypothetical protein
VKAEEEAAAKVKAEEEAAAKVKAEEEAAAKVKYEEEAAAIMKDEEEAAAKVKAEEEAAAKVKAEEEAAGEVRADKDTIFTQEQEHEQNQVIVPILSRVSDSTPFSVMKLRDSKDNKIFVNVCTSAAMDRGGESLAVDRASPRGVVDKKGGSSLIYDVCVSRDSVADSAEENKVTD